MSERERAMMFHRGFGDGARRSAKRHKDNSDYLAGWSAGTEAFTDAFGRWALASGVDPSEQWILRDETRT